MVFSSTLFLFAFFPAFFLCHFLATRWGAAARNANLLAFSLIFYFAGAGAYVLLLIALTIFNWACGLWVENRKSRALIALAVTANMLPLLVFKYADFLRELANEFVFQPTLGVRFGSFGFLLPIGISFYTFQGVSYVVDVWRGEFKAERSLLAFSAYKAAFPQLIAGPIVRYAEVKDTIRTVAISGDDWSRAIALLSVGMAFKMLIADPAGAQVDLIYGLPANEVNAFSAWFAAGAYSLQIFFDFSGYSLMAIGMGLMLGFRYPQNFNQPYRSTSITEFWRRWHMSLSRWFRDYLYIPLGGNRAGLGRTAFNLWVVFLLCGLWHGAALTYAVWGAYHGVLLVMERFMKRSFGLAPAGPLGFALTLFLVVVGWVFFRAETLSQAWSMLAKMFFIDTSGVSPYGTEFFLTRHALALFAVGGVLAIAPLDRWRLRERIAGWPGAIVATLSLLLLALAVGEMATRGFNPFIYFQF